MKLYTIAEIAKTLKIPESTAHYYRKRFDEYIPSEGEGRYRRYKAEALDVFTLIVSLVKEGVSLNEVENSLQQQFPITIETEQLPTTVQRQQQSNSILQEIMNEAINNAMQQQTEQIRHEMELMRREIAVTQTENKQLQTQLEEHLKQRDKVLMETLRTLQDRVQEETKKKPWWRFGR